MTTTLYRVYDAAGHSDNWRWHQFQEVVRKHGGTVLAHVGNRAKVRVRGDVMWMAYTAGDVA